MADSRRTIRNSWYAAASAVLIIVLLAAGREVMYPVRGLMWHAEALLWWFVVLGGALGQGAWLLKWVKGDTLELPEGLALSCAAGLGLGMLSLEVLALGALGLMNTPVLTLMALVFLALSMLTCRSVVVEILSAAAGKASGTAHGVSIPSGFALITVAAVFPLVLVPNRAFDALSYHLEVPLRFLQAGGIINMPENIYSYSPLLTQMLYGLGLGLAGADLAGLLYLSFFVLTLWTVWQGGEKLFGSDGSAWAAALLALTPVFLLEVPQAGADWSMTFFIITALLLVADGGRDTRRMVLAGILAGMAAGCRHQALGYAVVLIPAAGLIVDLRGKQLRSFWSWSVFTLAALTSAGPWYIKNLLQTGDPIYPLLTSLTGGLANDVGFVEGLVGSKPVHLLWSWVLVPFQSAFDPLSLSMTATVGILPLALALLLPGLKKQRVGSGFLLVWVVLSFAAWYLTFRTFRYVMPVMAVIYLWLGAALVRSMDGNGVKEKALKYAVCLALAVNGGIFLGLTDYVNRSIAPALGIRSPERYINETYEPFAAIDYLNGLEHFQGKVLFLGEMRGFYSSFPREVPSHNAPNRLFEMVKRGTSPSSIAAQLRDAGFSHIIFNPAEWERMAYGNRNAPLWQLNDHDKASVFSFLQGRTRTLFTANGVSVHRISHE